MISNEAIKTLLFDLAKEYPRYGYKILIALLKSPFDIRINKKKVYRLCKEMGLLLPVERHYRLRSTR
ncbi:MAG: transposase [Thermoanaerobacteraceae bacterium]|nr:transposase [Thermoanaerobacteraceae bacterium]